MSLNIELILLRKRIKKNSGTGLISSINLFLKFQDYETHPYLKGHIMAFHNTSGNNQNLLNAVSILY